MNPGMSALRQSEQYLPGQYHKDQSLCQPDQRPNQHNSSNIQSGRCQTCWEPSQPDQTKVYALAPCLIGNLKAGPSQGQLSPSQVMPNNRPEAGLEKFNSINTIANTGETVISGRRKSRKSAGPTRKTGLTRKEGTSCSPCWRDTTLLTIPSLDCSSVWLLILMLLLFSLCFSLPYGISHSTTTRYLLASCFSLLHNNIRPSKNLLEREGLAVDLSSIIFRAKMITSWFVSKTLVALGLFAGFNLCQSSSFPLGDSSWDCQLPVQVVLLGLVILFSGLISPSNY